MNEQQRASSSWDPFLADSLFYLSLAITFPNLNTRSEKKNTEIKTTASK